MSCNNISSCYDVEMCNFNMSNHRAAVVYVHLNNIFSNFYNFYICICNFKCTTFKYIYFKMHSKSSNLLVQSCNMMQYDPTI